MPFQWVSSFYAPTIVSATSAATNYPASRLVSRTRPFRAWRSTSTATQTIIMDLGSAVTVVGACLYHCNYSQVFLAHSDNAGGPWVAFSGSPYATAEDAHDRYRKAWCATASYSDRYLRMIILTETPTDGAAYFFAGTLFVFGAINTLPAQSGPVVPIPMQLIQPRYEANAGGRVDVLRSGQRYLTQSWTARMKESNYATWKAMQLHDLSNPTLVYFNRGNTEEVYYVGYTGEWSFDLKQVPTVLTTQWQQVT